MEDKILEAINHVRNKHITKTKTSIDQSQLMEAFESTKVNGVIFNNSKGKRESYFVANKNNNSWIISNKSATKVKTLTCPKLTPPSTPDETSIFGNSMLTSKKLQPSTTPIPVTPKAPTYNTKEVPRKHLFSDGFFLQKEITFLWKELDNKCRKKSGPSIK